MAYADQLFKNGKVLPSMPPATPPPCIQVAGNRSLSVPLPERANFFEMGLNQKQGRWDYARRETMTTTASEMDYGRAQSGSLAPRTYFFDEEIFGGLRHPHKDRDSPPSSPQDFSMPERNAVAVAAPAVAHVAPINRERGLGVMEGPTLKTTHSLQESYKRRSIKSLLFRSASHGCAQPKNKLGEHTADVGKTDQEAGSHSNEIQLTEKKKKKMMKKEKSKEKEKEKEKEMRIEKKTAVQRPGLLLCIGYQVCFSA